MSPTANRPAVLASARSQLCEQCLCVSVWLHVVAGIGRLHRQYPSRRRSEWPWELPLFPPQIRVVDRPPPRPIWPPVPTPTSSDPGASKGDRVVARTPAGYRQSPDTSKRRVAACDRPRIPSPPLVLWDVATRATPIARATTAPYWELGFLETEEDTSSSNSPPRCRPENRRR